jgi:hypothetical protein
MNAASEDGILFRRDAGGRRSTLAVNRAVFAAAARAADEDLADRVEAESDWRSNYVGYVRDLTARGARSADNRDRHRACRSGGRTGQARVRS